MNWSVLMWASFPLIMVVGVIVWALVKWAFSPVICKKCKSKMLEYYDVEGKIIEYKCPNCGHKEVV